MHAPPSTRRSPTLFGRHARARAALALATVLVFPTAAFAQATGTVTGRVQSAGTGAPIAGASILVGGTQFGAITREDGTYRVQLPVGRYELRARLIGYATATQTVQVEDGQTATADFTLEPAAAGLAAVAVIGTRGEARTVTDAPVPIDVLTAAEIRSTGRTETAQILQMLAPSANFPRATIGDGTDHMRPATLRGLAPDQVLVLINGKRRHTGALINVNGTIGRGSSAVDLNAIPANMIERIEVLRDGAAAQYGSDAIAGVINIVLKSGGEGEFSSMLGGTYTSFEDYAGNEHERRDGGVTHLGVNWGRATEPNRYVHIGGEFRNREHTNRTLPDPRRQYFVDDPRNDNPMLPTPDRINHRQGDAATRDFTGFLNASTVLENGVQAYAFGGGSRRDGEAAGFFRRPLDARTIRAIHPDGFLPLITSDIWDASGSIGAKGTVRGMQWDLSATQGINSFGFNVERSNNASMGLFSPTSFHAGTLRFRQTTLNLDLFRELGRLGASPLRVATGAEYRSDNFRIIRGEPASYVNGRIRVLDGPDSNAIAGVGAQVFPGFQPTDERDVSRDNVAAYLDLESDLTHSFLLGVAGRVERYSDFGSTATFKVSSRLTPLPGWVLRGAVGTGFRAPSLSQSYFSSTATNFISGVPFEIRTFPVNTPAARILGARPLEPERSVNYSAGIGLEPLRGLSVTVDGYRIEIDDRIVFSENFTGQDVRDLLAANGITDISGGRFFSNAIDTRTTGLDVVASYGQGLGAEGVLRLTGGYNANRTKVTRVRENPPELAAQNEALFGRVEQARIERGQPRDNVLLSATFDRRSLSLTARTQRFGEVTSFGAAPVGAANNTDQTFSAKWITDLSAGVGIAERLRLTVGADNVFDVYPDRNSVVGDPTTSFGGNANFGIFPFSGISPFGFNGRFLYARATYGF